jgi:hypothetical protein
VEDSVAALASRLASYPTVERFHLTGGSTSDPRSVRVVFPVEHANSEHRLVREVAEQYRDDRSLYLRPSLGSERRVPSALMTWWAVLLALSQLARYVPAAWTAALDRDSSTLAVPIEKDSARLSGSCHASCSTRSRMPGCRQRTYVRVG